MEDITKGKSIGGSLATLLASYGDDSSDGFSEHELCENQRTRIVGQNVPPDPVSVDKAESAIVELLENPVYNEGGNSLESALNVKPVVNNGEVVKTMVDFGTLRKENGKEVNLELTLDDLLPLTESYSEARTIKIEVESDNSDSESSADSSGSDDSEEEEGQGEGSMQTDQERSEKIKKTSEGPKVKGELGILDLPPIEDLHISVPEEECKAIGVIKSVVEPLVIVEANLGTPALDLDSVLFLDKGERALGHIFDVIGQVKQPIYCVRFNSKEHIEKNKVEVGMPVYCAPKTPYTTYVFLAQLRKMKGSDASWLNDIEPPREEMDFSDDEMEKIAKKKRRNRKLLNAHATEEDATYREDEESSAMTTHRGKKRNHNDRPMPHYSNNHTPYLPPNVPGFTPSRPPVGYQGHHMRAWGHEMNRMRAPGAFMRQRTGTGGHRFRRSMGCPPPMYAAGFHQNPYLQSFEASQWGTWHPPHQWQNQNIPNINFVGSPYPQAFAISPSQHHVIRGPPSPPPPPPGHSLDLN